jgi:hypothetical protein
MMARQWLSSVKNFVGAEYTQEMPFRSSDSSSILLIHKSLKDKGATALVTQTKKKPSSQAQTKD